MNLFKILKLSYFLIFFIACNSSSSFDDENLNSEHYVLKQLNVMPNINYVYMFNRSYIKSKFLEKNYKMSFSKDNDFKKINFNNLKYFCKKINYTDILFEKIK